MCGVQPGGPQLPAFSFPELSLTVHPVSSPFVVSVFLESVPPLGWLVPGPAHSPPDILFCHPVSRSEPQPFALSHGFCGFPSFSDFRIPCFTLGSSLDPSRSIYFSSLGRIQISVFQVKLLLTQAQWGSFFLVSA